MRSFDLGTGMTYTSLQKSLRDREFSAKKASSPYFRQSLRQSTYLVEKLSLSHTLTGHRGCVNTILFSEDGNHVFTGSDDTYVHLYDVDTGNIRTKLKTKHTNNIFYVKDLPYTNGNIVVSCAADGKVLLSNIENDTCSQLFTHRGRAHRLSLIPNSPCSFYSCGEDGKCCFFDTRSLPIHSTTERFRTFDDASIVKTVFRNETNRVSSVYCIHVNPVKPHELAVAGSSPFVAVYDARKLQDYLFESCRFETPCFKLCPDHLAHSSDHVTGVKFNYSGGILLASYNDEDIYSMDIHKHSKLNSRKPESGNPLESIIDECSDSSGDNNGYLRRFQGHRNNETVKQVAFFGSRSDWVVSGSDCGHIFIWSTHTGDIVKILDGDSIGATNCFDNHPNMPLLASSGLENDGKIWSPYGPRERLNALDERLWEKSHMIMKRNLNERNGSRGRSSSTSSVSSRMMLQLLQSYFLREDDDDEPSDARPVSLRTRLIPRSFRLLLRAYESMNGDTEDSNDIAEEESSQDDDDEEDYDEADEYDEDEVDEDEEGEEEEEEGGYVEEESDGVNEPRNDCEVFGSVDEEDVDDICDHMLDGNVGIHDPSRENTNLQDRLKVSNTFYNELDFCAVDDNKREDRFGMSDFAGLTHGYFPGHGESRHTNEEEYNPALSCDNDCRTDLNLIPSFNFLNSGLESSSVLDQVTSIDDE